MSRGLGSIQQGCLLVLGLNPTEPLDSITITGLVVCRDTITDAEHVSVRRALRALARAGKVIDMGRAWHDKRKRWALPETAVASYRMDAVMGITIPESNRHLVEATQRDGTP